VETDKSGVLKVIVDSFTPGGADGLMVKVNEDNWQSQSQTVWDWQLLAGLNTIKVRTKNTRGILGPVSEIQVSYNP